MTADVERAASRKRRSVGWAIAGVLCLAAGLTWLLLVGYGSIDWPDFVDPWIGYTKPIIILAIIGAAACFVRAVGSYRASRTDPGPAA